MRVVALAGGTGGAKLAHGLRLALPAGSLSIVVNTADDTIRHGLLIMPDHDAVLYMLTDRFDDERGWGIVDETWTVMDALAAYGDADWFRLGDRDIATHLARHARLAGGTRLTAAVLDLQRSAGLVDPILPMTDDAVRTVLRTDEGWLDFQEYFVHRHQAPEVREVRFDGIEASRPSPEVLAVVAAADRIILGPSNPLVSIGPILAVPGLAEAIAARREGGAEVIAVSPIVGGRALKGPADRMLASSGHDVSALGVARLYRRTVDRFVIDTADAALGPAIEALGIDVTVTDTVMADDEGRERLARDILALRPVRAR